MPVVATFTATAAYVVVIGIAVVVVAVIAAAAAATVITSDIIIMKGIVSDVVGIVTRPSGWLTDPQNISKARPVTRIA